MILHCTGADHASGEYNLDESLYNAPRNRTPFVDDSDDAPAAFTGISTDTAPRELQDAKAQLHSVICAV